jgi:hypothetical protein
MNYLNGKNPFIKLMIIGRINQRIRELLSKERFDEIDSKLIKGIFKKSSIIRPPLKGIKETFNPYLPRAKLSKNNIIRKMKDFVLRESCDDLGLKYTNKEKILESIEKLYV